MIGAVLELIRKNGTGNAESCNESAESWMDRTLRELEEEMSTWPSWMRSHEPLVGPKADRKRYYMRRAISPRLDMEI